jgi:hypothetical protein
LLTLEYVYRPAVARNGGLSTAFLLNVPIVKLYLPSVWYDATYDTFACTGTGSSNGASCHPEDVSPKTDAVASIFPSLDHKLTVCALVFSFVL